MHTHLRTKLYGARRRQSGFNLVELMLVLAIASVLVSIAVPNFREFIRNGRLTSASNDLLASLQLARNEAVKRQLPVAVCATADPQAAVPVCSGGTFNAWVVWVDADNDWVVDNNVNEPVLSRAPALDATLMVRNDNMGRVKYTPVGFTAAASGGITPSTRIVLCDERGNGNAIGASAARAVQIGATGRPRVTRDRTEITNTLNAFNATCP